MNGKIYSNIFKFFLVFSLQKLIGKCMLQKHQKVLVWTSDFILLVTK